MYHKARLLSLVAILCSLLLAGCPQGSRVPPSLERVFPTVTPTIVPSPTPTREDEIVIPFESIAVNQLIDIPSIGGTPESVTFITPTYNDELEQIQEPLAFVILSREDTDLLTEWFPSNTVDILEEVDYDQYVVVALFIGLSGPCCDGYIQHIATHEDGLLTIYATLRNRSSGADEITFPYHIVKIQRQDVPFLLSTDVSIQIETETHNLN